ncbi:Ubiquitin-related modifier 1-like [Porphyridium purpureum]|uniref:Ubiquitin-related modifier 1 homolog n=1 Tax=Porphyridium purpureum TaxID=35688 RepID=A0A5J4YUF2_PORPP|nr:Ubiquitin-related modifier 1-like [Porphyridium purpureum]|eukprot:POR3573..scf227_4
MVRVELCFGGGLEALLGGQKRTPVDVPDECRTMGKLILWIRDTLISERHDMFMKDDCVRPGILVLINSSDWELEGTTQYVLEPGDSISFISTLHGG